MSSLANALSLDAVRRLSIAARLNASALVLTAAGMGLQIAAGSSLYPSLAGPIILVATAGVVVFGPDRGKPYVALAVPLVLGVGAIAAAAMTGTFIAQLTDIGGGGIFVGSVMHAIGLVAAVAGGIGMLRDERAGQHER